MIICQKNGAVLRRNNSISLGTEELSPRNDRCRIQSAFSARQDNAEWMKQRIHTIVIKSTPIRAQCNFGVALFNSVIDARCCKEHFVSRRPETDRICTLNGQKGRKGRKKKGNGERERGLRWPTEPQKQRQRWFRPQVRIEGKTKDTNWTKGLSLTRYSTNRPKKREKNALKLLKKLASGPPRALDLKPEPRGKKPQRNKKET